MEIVSKISLIVGVILSIISVITLVVNFIRNKKNSIESLKEGVKALLRSEILKIYYHNCDKKELRQYQREALDKLYEAYRALGGNSFIVDVYEEIRDWRVFS